MKWPAGALCLLAALAIVGCGSGDSTGSGAQGGKGSGGMPVASTEPSSIAVAVVSADEIGGLGTILVDAQGRTLYVFHRDKRTTYVGISSACYRACAESWPPLLTGGEPQAGSGAIETKLGTLKRKDGTLQVTYYGHPLYTYVGDTGSGEATGNAATAFGGQWHALNPNDKEP
jgi:predicted lipoprotein with Yx(FWY)xxD motif